MVVFLSWSSREIGKLSFSSSCWRICPDIAQHFFISAIIFISLQIANLVNSKFRSLAICSRLWFHQSGGAEGEEGQRGCSQTVFVITSSYFSEYLHTFFPPITKSFLSDPSPIIGYACHWLTDSLTDCRLVNLIDVTLACEDAYSKLVEVVTLADVSDEDRVGNSLLQIWKLRSGHKA